MARRGADGTPILRFARVRKYLLREPRLCWRASHGAWIEEERREHSLQDDAGHSWDVAIGFDCNVGQVCTKASPSPFLCELQASQTREMFNINLATTLCDNGVCPPDSVPVRGAVLTLTLTGGLVHPTPVTAVVQGIVQ
jgi:hypothetical protein